MAGLLLHLECVLLGAYCILASEPAFSFHLGDLGVAVGDHNALCFRGPFPLLAGGMGMAVASSSHWLAGAKPSRFTSEMPLTTVWLILTTPTRPRRARSSTSSWLNSSGS